MTVIDKESRHNGAIYIEIKNYLEILSKGGSVIVQLHWPAAVSTLSATVPKREI